MSKKNIIITICFLCLVFPLLILSNSYVRSRINAHINAWLGIIPQAKRIVVVLPEGTTNKEMAEIFASRIPKFSKEEFLIQAEGLQGYLFPDTYFLTEGSTPISVIKMMQDAFWEKARPEFGDVYNRSQRDIIIVASLIEEESKGEDAGLIAGILWKRLDKGMLLQVDVAPDTYKTLGLPKAPITNPGTRALFASAHPIKSDYFFYLHDKNGMIHFARTYAEHQRNIKEYLK